MDRKICVVCNTEINNMKEIEMYYLQDLKYINKTEELKKLLDILKNE